jgi:hypothetical protein
VLNCEGLEAVYLRSGEGDMAMDTDELLVQCRGCDAPVTGVRKRIGLCRKCADEAAYLHAWARQHGRYPGDWTLSKFLTGAIESLETSLRLALPRR